MGSPPFDQPPQVFITIIGIVAIITGLIYRVPQFYRTYKVKSAEDISVYMLLIQNTSYIAYIFYGIFVWDWIYIISSFISFAQNALIFLMRRHYIALNLAQGHGVELGVEPSVKLEDIA